MDSKKKPSDIAKTKEIPSNDGEQLGGASSTQSTKSNSFANIHKLEEFQLTDIYAHEIRRYKQEQLKSLDEDIENYSKYMESIIAPDAQIPNSIIRHKIKQINK